MGLDRTHLGGRRGRGRCWPRWSRLRRCGAGSAPAAAPADRALPQRGRRPRGLRRAGARRARRARSSAVTPQGRTVRVELRYDAATGRCRPTPRRSSCRRAWSATATSSSPPPTTGGAALPDGAELPVGAHVGADRARRDLPVPGRAERRARAATAPTPTARWPTWSRPARANLEGNGDDPARDARPASPGAVDAGRRPARICSARSANLQEFTTDAGPKRRQVREFNGRWPRSPSSSPPEGDELAAAVQDLAPRARPTSPPSSRPTAPS